MGRRTRTLLTGWLGWAGLLSLPQLSPLAGAVQARSPVPRRAQTAALPESNEAMLLAGRAGEAVKQGDFRLAIKLIEQIMDLPDALVSDPDQPVYYPVWRQARRLLTALPPDGLAYYRQVVDPEAEARFQEAVRSSSVEELRRLFRAYPVSTVAPKIGSELVSRLMERGDNAQAIDTLHELASTARSDEPVFARRARLAVALARLGAWTSSLRVVESLEADQRLANDPRALRRVGQLRGWLDELGQAGSSTAKSAETSLAPLLSADSTWERKLPIDSDAAPVDDSLAMAQAIDEFRRLPLIEPMIAGDTLLVRTGGQLRAYDALSLTRLWQTPEIPLGVSVQASRIPRFGQPIAPSELEEGDESSISAETRDLLYHSLRHAVSAGFGNVYTIESLTPLPDPAAGRDFRGGLFRRRDEHAFANQLVARELATGKQVWLAGADTTDPLFGVAFQDAPIVVGRQLLVPVQRDDDILLCVLDPATGRLVRETPIVGPPTVLSAAGGRCLTVRDDTTVYVCTGNGVIAAISSATWEWSWAATYPSTLGRQLANRMIFRSDLSQPELAPPMRPVIAGDLLIVAPVDSAADEIIAIDRFSGGIRWRVDRSDDLALAGTIDDQLILCGNRITSVDLADGSTVRWRSIPIELSGRPAIRGRRVYVPARDVLLVLDADTGKIVDDHFYPVGEPGVGNLTVSADALFSVSPLRVAKYPDLSATRAQCRRIIATRPDDPRAHLSLARVDMLSGDYQAALGMIEAMGAADTALESEREELLVQLFVSLSKAAPAGQDKLSWLRRAESLSLTTRTAGQMSMLIGRALEEAGRPAEAMSHYREMLLADESPMLSQSGGRIVGWLHAVRRVRALLPQVSESQRAAWRRELLSAVFKSTGDEVLPERALLVVDDPSSVQRLSRAMLLRARHPEVAIEYLPRPDASALALTERRSLHLARWETHLALGMLDAAEQDRAYWREELAFPAPASQPTSADATRDEQRARLKKLEIARRKLLDTRGAAPAIGQDVRRRWMLGLRNGRFQLLTDSRDLRAVVRPWLLVRDLNEHELQLRNANRGTKLRATSAATLSSAMPGIIDDETSNRFAFGDFERADAGVPATWPTVYHRHMAVVPVRGGLVCVGLGPERGGGTRLWEYEISQPFDIARDFTARAVGGPHGFYFAHRDDRIVCLDWDSGQPRWERDFVDLRVQQLFVSGEALIVIGQNREIVVMNAEFGDNLRTPPATLHSPDWSTAIGDTVVISSGRSLVGLSASTLEYRWDRSGDSAVPAWFALPERNWIAFREQVSSKWTVLDVGSGKEVFETEIPDLTRVTAAAVTGGRLLVSGPIVQMTTQPKAPRILLASIDTESGKVVWRRQSGNMIQINTTQLDALPGSIPVLTVGGPLSAAGGTAWWEDDAPDFGIELLDRNTGASVGGRIKITEGFVSGRHAAEAFLLASPSRLIISAGGRLVAYGTSR